MPKNNKYSDESDNISEYETDTESLNENDDRVTKEFNDSVLKYIQLDDTIKDLVKETAKLKKIKKPLEKYILEYLGKINETIIDLHGIGSRLRKNKSETKKQLKQDQIKETLMEQLGDIKKVNKILESMEKKREKQVHINIKRTNKKE
jgi:hypothetical protein